MNNKLSMRRAEDTKRELVRRYGVSPNRINTFGKGKTPGPWMISCLTDIVI